MATRPPPVLTHEPMVPMAENSAALFAKYGDREPGNFLDGPPWKDALVDWWRFMKRAYVVAHGIAIVRETNELLKGSR